MNNIVEITNVSKKFDQKFVVDDVDFSVKEGEILGLLGPNGAGKSTLINMITGLLRISKGTIKVFGETVSEQNRKMRKHIGVVPQELALYFDLTARENVAFFGGLYGLRGKELNQAVDRALEAVGLKDREKDKPDTFSGGMQRRLNIAMAIVHSPELVIMDEPTVGIDPQSRNYILETIEQMRENGTTVIYTSHYMEEVERLADTIVIIDHGKVIAQGSENELVSLITDQKNILIQLVNPDALRPEHLRTIIGVKQIVLDENQLMITANVENNVLNQVLEVLLAQKVIVESIEQQQINLETVFLNLTGRTLRDK
ncbi:MULTISPECIES: ABC transporter ATP-binding protein [unclassified Enterococcus]|jgi:ABC-2 type transport system ATP-binding protein|uniref:ABC transporter ATP-binding protein n=1 Tax=unclassified Enterococcus TaxID=2608891 RepID=UPI000353FFD0|nr:putative ABC transporter, ATP-binding protein SagG [Enterococcus faecalis 13-SD-W-01]